MSRLMTILNALALLILLAMPAAVHAQDATDAGAPDAASPYGVAHTVTLSTGTLTYIEVAPDQSPRAVLQQMEEDDIENGTADSRTTPYMVVQRQAVQMNQLYLPLIATTKSLSAVASDRLQQYQSSSPLAGDYRLDEDELRRAQSSYTEADAFVREFATALNDDTSAEASSVSAISGYVRVSQSVGGLNPFFEPNELAYRNYCGPSTMRVVLDATGTLAQLPSITDLAHALMYTPEYNCDGRPGFNPEWGTTACAMCLYLHRWYIHQWKIWRYQPNYLSSPNEYSLWNQVVYHVVRNYTIPTGTHTDYLWAWNSDIDARHINAIIGYDGALQQGTNNLLAMYSIRYAETGSRVAGYTGGQFKVWRLPYQFWQAVQENNVQCMLYPGL